MEIEENRRFRRLRASIPCTIAWEEEVLPAEVTNLSHGGALITGTGRIPDEGTPVVLLLPVGQEEIRFRAQARKIAENDQPASFGVEFSETHQEIEAKLIQLMDVLYPAEEEESEDS
jgi:hypothetical protein